MTSQDNMREAAFKAFDAANAQDPNKEEYQGETYPKELLYAQRMTEHLDRYLPKAPLALQLAARCQHICRWTIPRNNYPMDRTGYLQWRQELKKFHADKAAELLEQVGCDQETIAQVRFLVQKKQLKGNADTQALEDVICLVFLEYYLEDFAQKYEDAKLVEILQKTWGKMSEKGRAAALELSLSPRVAQLVGKALGQ